MLRRVAIVRIVVSEEPTASIIRVTRVAKIRRQVAVAQSV
jgi:hypothetical protein